VTSDQSIILMEREPSSPEK